MRNDPEPEVRFKVAERVAPADGLMMIADDDWRVRLRLAKRLPIASIDRLARDEDADARAVAAARLEQLAQDEFDS